MFRLFAFQLDLTVTLGNLISLAGTILAVFAAYNRTTVRLAVLETKVDAMWERRKAQAH